jgi:hypothetical protein
VFVHVIALICVLSGNIFVIYRAHDCKLLA